MVSVRGLLDASAVGAAARVWGFEEPQAPRESVVAATRAEGVKMPRVMVMNIAVRENMRGAHCSGNHVKPRSLKELRDVLKATQGGNRGTPGVLSAQDERGSVRGVGGRGLVLI